MTSLGKKIVGLLVLVAIAGLAIWLLKESSDKGTGIPTFDFSQEGDLIKDNPGLEKGKWYLVYKIPGEPAKNVQLRLPSNSLCAEKGFAKKCSEVNLKAGMHVNIQGNVKGDKVDVIYLTIL